MMQTNDADEIAKDGLCGQDLLDQCSTAVSVIFTLFRIFGRLRRHFDTNNENAFGTEG